MQDSIGRFIKGTHWRLPKPHWRCDWLYGEYVVLGRSTGDMAAECQCTDANILYWLKRHGIDRRTISEARGLKYWGLLGADNPMHGKNGTLNPNYKDGSSPERQKMYARGEGKSFLRDILKRDEYRCQRCKIGKTKPKSLHVHHLKPWAGNKEIRFNPSNVITLCMPCHSWVHSRENATREFLL